MYNTMNNPSAHPSYSHYYLLSPSTLFFVFFFCTSYCFFAHLVVFLHISLSFAHLIVFCTIIVFCTSYCFALFYFIAHFILISPFLTICMPLCYVTYIICILIVLHCHWADLIRLHFTSSYALYNYYVTNKETLNLEPWTLMITQANLLTYMTDLWFGDFIWLLSWKQSQTVKNNKVKIKNKHTTSAILFINEWFL